MVPRVDDLHGIDDLRVESRGDLNSHACRKQNKIQVSQIRLLVPRSVIVGQQVGQDGLRDIFLTMLWHYNHDDQCRRIDAADGLTL